MTIHPCPASSASSLSSHFICSVPKRSRHRPPTVRHRTTSLSLPPSGHILTASRCLLSVVQPDVVVLEVGMGGRLDSTNAVTSPVVCGISSIGYDHMEVLGHTLSLIAREKAGIMKPNIPTLTIQQVDEVTTTLRQCAIEESATLHIVAQLPAGVQLGLDGEHQRENAALAVGLCQRVLEMVDGKNDDETKRLRQIAKATAAGHLPAEVLEGLRETRWPGRCQTYVDAEQSNLTYFVDGAHTDASMAVACAWFEQQVDQLQPSDTPTSPATSTPADGAESDELTLTPSPPLSSSPPNQPSYNILLFNTGHVRNPFDLLQPVVSLGVHNRAGQFGHVISCPFDHDRPHLQRTPSFESLAAQQPDEVKAVAMESTATPVVGTTWQHTLFRVFDTLLVYNLRKQQSAPLPAAGQLLSGSAAGAAGVRYPHRFVYASSSAHAVSVARGLARRHPNVRFRVFVCGSLYLVGNVLDKLGYRIT